MKKTQTVDRLCCCIPDQTKLDEPCQRPAVYQILYGYDPGPGDYSDSCAEHLEQLLDDNTRFEILRLPVGDVSYHTVDGKWWMFLRDEKHRELTDKEAADVIWGEKNGKETVS